MEGMNKPLTGNILHFGRDTNDKLARAVTYEVDINECWNITSHSLDKDGYGALKREIDGRVYRRAHRVSYAYFKGHVGENLSILHSCNNPSCINPDHLREGDHSMNMKDRLASGNYYENMHGTVKLNRELVLKIDSLLLSGATRKEASLETGVNISTVADIAMGKTWIHVTGKPKYRPKNKEKEGE